MNKTIVLVLMVLLVSNYAILESAAEIELKKSDQARCAHMYEKFLKMGEENLQKRYPVYRIVDLCLKLFHDPNWSFTGKNLIDEKYTSDSTYVLGSTPHLNSKVLAKTKIGPDRFLVKFNVCWEDAKKSNYLEITTDIEKVIGRLRISDNSCVSFWTPIRTTDPENTQFSGYYDVVSKSTVIKKLL